MTIERVQGYQLETPSKPDRWKPEEIQAMLKQLEIGKSYRFIHHADDLGDRTVEGKVMKITGDERNPLIMLDDSALLLQRVLNIEELQ